MSQLPPEQCCQLLGELLSRAPAVDDYSPGAVDWFNEATAVVAAHDSVRAVKFEHVLGDVSRTDALELIGRRTEHVRGLFISRIKVLYRTLALQTNSFTAVEVPRGNPHEYFEEVRALITKADQELLFAERYLEADFAKIYLPQIKYGVAVRLLTTHRSAASLSPAVELFVQQSPLAVEIRSLDHTEIHDRQLVVDGQFLYQSGASFKDGGRLSPSTISQIVDGAPALIASRESDWARATKQR